MLKDASRTVRQNGFAPMNPCRFSFGDAHPGLGVPEKFPGFGVSFFSSCSCREAASFNYSLKPTPLRGAAYLKCWETPC